ncbi:MAG: tRNA pseudouridine synthase A 2 [Ignavibacterium sp.]|jgi:tRNA pseudouridine38-40 synthase|nr:tRNA pseudouridine(38-40) synthase TruA [Ignavibacteria bacterium]MDH7528081.1 tRNA pseudouridine(38-40) synthase TruA [Ignavibacteria bacterium]GIV45463.1 MAG: tRNA pseudouridine synthase A 2 [Ignavibacterium sp.]
MPKFKLTIEYEGTRYSGWQIQRNARTIQGEIIGAIKKVFATNDFDFQGAGRTDAGVHALNQIAHLDVKTNLSEDKIKFALNDNLPSDINILAVEKVNKSFHARKDAKYRSYLYIISKRRTAFAKKFVWWIKDELNFEKMNLASRHFIGLKNFQSFADIDDEEKSTLVKIEDVQLKEEGSLILIRVIGSHFLWKMVRRMVGVLVEIGRENLTETELIKMFESNTDLPLKFTAPPSGLYLENVFYSYNYKLPELKSWIKL